MRLPGRTLLIGALLATGAAWGAPKLQPPRGSLQPDELGIVVREGDPVSEAIAEHYRQARGIPAANVVRLPIPVQGETIPAADFAALKTRLDEQLPARVQATLLTWVHPSRVAGGCAMSITSAFAFGYDDRRCSLGDRTGPLMSPYFDSDTTRPWDDLRIRPSMMLGAETLAEARVLIDRGVRADGTRPAGDGYFVRTSDAVRSLRWPDFVKAAAATEVHVELVDRRKGGGDALSGRTGVLFYFTGLARTPDLTSNTYRPGAVGDSLTSSGGVLAGTQQTTVLEWLKAGVTGSYGTVEEPFAHAEKFPRVSVLVDHYVRGSTLIEAYWKSVQQPGQGLFVGEPLARPFADRPRWSPEADRSALTTRVLRPGGRYPVLFRPTPDVPWTAVTTLTGARAGDGTYRVPVTRQDDGELRVSELPCPDAPRIAATVRGDPAPLAAGRARRLVYQVELRLQPAPLGCADGEAATERIDLVAGPSGPGVVLRATEGLVLTPGVPTQARVEVGLSAAVTQMVAVPLEWRRAGAKVGGALGGWRIAVVPATADRPLRIVEPGPGWNLASARRGRALRLPVVADVDPDSAITRVRFLLRGALGGAMGGPSIEVPASAPGYAAELVVPSLPAGLYRLVAQGEDRTGAVVSTASVLVTVPPP